MPRLAIAPWSPCKAALISSTQLGSADCEFLISVSRTPLVVISVNIAYVLSRYSATNPAVLDFSRFPKSMPMTELQSLMRRFEGYLYDCTREIRSQYIDTILLARAGIHKRLFDQRNKSLWGVFRKKLRRIHSCSSHTLVSTCTCMEELCCKWN